MAVILWFNDLPLWQTGFLIAGGAMLISIVGTAVSRSFFAEQQLNLNNVVGGFQYMFLSQVFAGFIGFLLFGVYERFDRVRSDIVTEVSVLTTLDRLAVVFPERTQGQIRTSLRDYARTVIDLDWPQMQSRSGTISTVAALDDLEYLFGSIETTSKKQREVVKLSRELVTSVRNDRSSRLFRSYGTLLAPLWTVAILAMAVAIVLPWVFGTPNVNADLGMSMLTIVMMAAIVLVVLKLSYPFGGASGLPPDLFAEFAGRSGARGG
ncbi:MAG: DUF4239 domain-containing protein [Alphaproteobacteria bacterium]|nr:DUF4239 domain-containing protein [Alphaproteobacteria bacterium]